jgi:hypothetical protein
MEEIGDSVELRRVTTKFAAHIDRALSDARAAIKHTQHADAAIGEVKMGIVATDRTMNRLEIHMSVLEAKLNELEKNAINADGRLVKVFDGFGIIKINLASAVGSLREDRADTEAVQDQLREAVAYTEG